MKLFCMRKYLDAYAPSLGELWFIMLALVCVGGSIVSGVIAFVSQFVLRLDSTSLTTIAVAAYPCTFILAIPFIYFRARERYRLHSTPPHPWSATFGTMPALLVFGWLLLLVPAFSTSIEPLTMWMPMPDFIKKLFDSFTQSGWVSFISVVIMAPLLEEWLLRGVALKGLLQRGYSPVAAICWSALMFGVIHMNPWQAIPAFSTGVLFGWVYWRTRSLWTTIFMHAVNNGISFLITVLFPELPEDVSTLDLVGPGNYPWVLSAAIAVSILIIWQLHKRLTPAS